MLVKNQFKLIKITKKNIEWYLDKGYDCKLKDEIKVKAEDLFPTCDERIKFICDYCGEESETDFDSYYRHRYNTTIHKDCCHTSKCMKEKEFEYIRYKQEKGLLTINDRGYWKFKENILKELDKYIKQHNTVINIKIDEIGKKIYHKIHYYKYDINDLIIELGYDPNKINFKQTRIFDDENTLKTLLLDFIDKHKHFPTEDEIRNELGFNNHCIKKYGGIYNLKRLINWDNDNLLDDNNWYNKSVYEFIVAQYLIHNDISYKREQSPFSEEGEKYRSDFMFELDNGEKIHCEVWGMDTEDYEIRKNKKIELYKKYNIKLISIDYIIFAQPFNKIQESLYDIFKECFKIKHRILKSEIIIPIPKMSDEELLEGLLKYSEDKDYLPTVTTLRKEKVRPLYYEVFKRYGSYLKFAKKYGKKLYSKGRRINKNQENIKEVS